MLKLDLRKAPSSPDLITSAANSFSSFDVSLDTSPSDKTVFARAASAWERAILRKSSKSRLELGSLGWYKLWVSEQVLPQASFILSLLGKTLILMSSLYEFAAQTFTRLFNPIPRGSFAFVHTIHRTSNKYYKGD